MRSFDLLQIVMEGVDIFETSPGDRIGFTSEDTVCPVSMDSPAGHATLRRSIGQSYPELGSTYSFTEQPVDAIFSIGLEAKPCEFLQNDLFKHTYFEIYSIAGVKYN